MLYGGPGPPYPLISNTGAYVLYYSCLPVIREVHLNAPVCENLFNCTIASEIIPGFQTDCVHPKLLFQTAEDGPGRVGGHGSQ